MTGKGRIASAGLIGIAIGIASVKAGHARRVEAAPGCSIIAEVQVTTLRGWQNMAHGYRKTLAPFTITFSSVAAMARASRANPQRESL